MAPALLTAGVPSIPHWKRPEKTTADLPWADIKVIDLSTYDLPGGKERLAEDLREAVSCFSNMQMFGIGAKMVIQVHKTGFFSLTSTGFTPEEVQRQYDIGQEYFHLPVEEKGDAKYRCDFTQGNYFGYRPVRV
jgi:gibberellin 2-oxidase